ncbi:unnamed protein product [Bursaphelenchus xylophilus]|uniref:(pine wood nematode) hypothetical protein n=1 Tax=Bursaphelenchus xylophilus TaxID=6326 RepID=A0A1I7RJ95_BURXY|nr:unnamed protein product [Bursaphelenchus xylophilus]CAG9119486.1 unnamed protein product [Bursaphelenchus xylophilus]
MSRSYQYSESIREALGKSDEGVNASMIDQIRSANDNGRVTTDTVHRAQYGDEAPREEKRHFEGFDPATRYLQETSEEPKRIM